MGSQLTISLQSLLNVPSLEVRLLSVGQADACDNEGVETFIKCAQVTFNEILLKSKFGRFDLEPFVYSFDYTAYAGKVALHTDFNFLRYAPDSLKMQLLRNLYEHGVDFTVSH